MTGRNLYPRWTNITWILLLPLSLVVIGGMILGLTDAGELPFDNTDLWWLIVVVPVGSLIALYGAARRRRAMERFTSTTLAPLLATALSPWRVAVRSGLYICALFMLVIALLGPRWGIYLEKQQVYGIDIATVVDVSRSMLADDLSPNRLVATKTEIRQQLTERAVFQGAHRLALNVFSGSSLTRLPLTTDHLAFREKLQHVNAGRIGKGGTDIGAAIEQAIDLFSKSPEKATKIVLLFTDGEDHEGRGEEAARMAYDEHGVRVFTIGVGDPNSTTGAQVPDKAARRGKPMLHDGQIVFSRLDTAGLRRIAEAGNGRYVPLNNLNRVVDAIAGMRQTELSTEERMRHKPRYQWFLAAALILIGLETIMGHRRLVPEEGVMRVWGTSE